MEDIGTKNTQEQIVLLSRKSFYDERCYLS